MPSNLVDLTGHVALVTGGNSGVGLGMAEGLARAGADVCIWGTSGAKNRAALDQLRPHGTRVVGMEVDVGDEAAVVSAMAAVADELGTVNSCFANAAMTGGYANPPFV